MCGGRIKTFLKRQSENYYCQYTFCFLITFSFCFFWFLLKNKSFFRNVDGLDQHYVFFIYVGQWIREVLRNLFFKHELIFPMWDMSMGYGSDIFPTIPSAFCDPFNWISVFCSEKYAEDVLNVIVFLKFYVTGLAFSYFGLRKKYDNYTILFGSILYTFSATMYTGFIQYSFINPMYIFPIVIVGTDKVWEKESPAIFILGLAWTFINNFYFAYMTGFFLLGYCILYYIFDYPEKKSIKNLVSWILKFICYCIISVGISMIVLLPILGILVGQDRLTADYFLPKLYDKYYYANFFIGLFSSFSMSGRDAVLGFGVIVLFCISYIFTQKQYLREKIEFISLSAFLCIPYFGHVLNGFSYYSNRWVWVYCLCVVNIACIAMSKLRNMDKNSLKKMFFFILLYLTLTSMLIWYYNSKFITNIILIVAIYFFIKEINRNYTEKVVLFNCGMICIAVVCVTIQAFYWYAPIHGNGTASEVKRGTALSKVKNGNGLPALNDISRSEGFRFDESGLDVLRNANCISKGYGFDLYISLYNDEILRFQNTLALKTAGYPQEFFGLDRRSELEYLMGTKYFLIPEGKTQLLPFGYTKLDTTKKVCEANVSRYVDEECKSVIFGYKNSINKSVYDYLTPYERQQLLMRCCVTENSKNYTIPDLPNDKLNSIEILSDCIKKIDDNTFEILQNDAELSLKIQEVSLSEIYVDFENIRLKQDKKDRRENYGFSVKAQYKGNDIEDMTSSFWVPTNRTHMYAEKYDWMVNLGYTEQIVDSIIIKFHNAGVYTYDSLDVYAKPEEELESSRNNFVKVTDIVYVKTNGLSANLTIEEPGYVYIAVPYSPGWKAELNGKPIKLEKANVAFMAFYTEPGKYNLQLSFFTPWLKIGFFITLVFLLMFIILLKTNYNIRKKRKVAN